MGDSFYIYGAGVFGKRCYEYLKQIGLKVSAFLVTEKANNPETLFDIPIYSLNQLKSINDNTKIIVALKMDYRNDVIKLLKKRGITNYDFYPEISLKNKTPIGKDYSDNNFFEIKKYVDYKINLFGFNNLLSDRKKQISNLKQFECLFNYLDESCCIIENEKILLAELENNKELVLLFSHDLNLTGAPVALKNFALVLKEIGKCPFVVSPRDGTLREEYLEKNIPFSIIPNILYNDFIKKTINCYSFAVFCTVTAAPIISKVNGLNLQVFWWIHEADISYNQSVLSSIPQKLDNNIKICCGGVKAQEALLRYRPDFKNVLQLLYTSPDLSKRNSYIPKNSKTIFANIGVFSIRKAQDVLCKAIMLLPYEYIEKSVFYFIGQPFDHFISEQLKILEKMFPSNVKVIDAMPQEELFNFYNKMDCLICTSKEDPMPIVVTDAFSMSKLVICSEFAGSAELIKEMDGGVIYNNNDAIELAERIKEVINNLGCEQFEQIKKNARKIYEKYFTYDVFAEKIKKILNDSEKNITADGMVSVIIPTYNGGNDIKCLIRNLFLQKKLSGIEVIIVDSESTDGTESYAEACGVKVIRIKQKDFSHSFARNLGAKNANGKYILFMTQDALPYDELFIIKMLQPILKKQAVAVSCRQVPRPTCDLLGRIQNYSHAKYMEIINENRILSMPKEKNYDSLRKNAQLDDVACLIKKDVFDLYKYRGNYAEDLDLGLRLIKDNYKLAILSSAKVIHSHTRSAFYHLKRSIVDGVALHNIISFDTKKITLKSTINQIISAFCFMVVFFKNNARLFDCFSLFELKKNIETIREQCAKIVKEYDSDKIIKCINTHSSIIEPELQNFIIQLLKFQSINDIKICLDLSNTQINYVLNSISIYIPKFEMSYTKENYIERINEILDLYIKFFGLSSGILIANYLLGHSSKKNDFESFIKQYTKGV